MKSGVIQGWQCLLVYTLNVKQCIMNILKCQGWQCLFVYFERQTMYREYIKMQTCKYVINVQK